MSHRIINYYPHFIFLCIVSVYFVSLSVITLFDRLSSAVTELLCFTYSLCLFITEFAQLSSVAIDGFAFFPFWNLDLNRVTMIGPKNQTSVATHLWVCFQQILKFLLESQEVFWPDV